jgi:hypothetical protein
VGSAQDDLDPLANLPDVKNHGADAFARLVALARDLLAPGEQGVGLAEVDGDRSTFEPLNGAGNQVTALIFELIKKTIAFGLANLLNDHLLGGLCRDPAEVGGGDGLAVGGRRGLSRLAIDRDQDLFGFGIMFLGGRGQRRFDPFEQNVLGDVLVAMDAIDDPDQIDAHTILRGETRREPRRSLGPGARTRQARSELLPRRAETSTTTSRWPEMAMRPPRRVGPDVAPAV